LDNHTIEYIRNKRKQYLFFLIVIGIFGLILFTLSRMKTVDTIDGYIESRGLTDLYDKISSSTTDSPLKKTPNLLESPKFIPYRIEGEKLLLEKAFTFQGKKITDAVFQIKQHGNTLFSDGFSSSISGLFCRGTVKKGSEKFMIYYCDER